VAESLIGRRVRLVFTDDPRTCLKPGDEGWVRSVQTVAGGTAGNVSVRWDIRDDAGPGAMIPGSDQLEWL
jgi:hypothetical protein